MMMPELDLDAIDKRYNEAEAACFVGDDFENWCANNISDGPALVERVRELEKDAELDELNAEEFETALIKKTERVLELEEDRSLSSEMIEQFTEGCKKQGVRIKALEAEVESLKNDARGCEDHCQHPQDRLDHIAEARE